MNKKTSQLKGWLQIIFLLMLYSTGSILILNLVLISFVSHLTYDNVEEVPHKKTALVLGTSKNGRRGINPYFKYRIEAAAELWFAGKVDQILVSGDNHHVSYDEPSDMANYLISLGVPDSVIIRDYAGFRTLDSVIRAKKVFNCQELIIVSQEFHNERALFIAKYFNIDAVAYNARDVQRKFNLPPPREFISKCWVFLDLFLLRTQPKFLGEPL